MEPDAADRLVAGLRSAVSSAADLLQDGWSFESAASRLLMQTHVPVLTFRRGENTLCFIVTPSEPGARVFKRTERHDLVYFSEDVADDQQSQIYQRDRAFIERFAAWLGRWDQIASATMNTK